jgi:hypothetical protein
MVDVSDTVPSSVGVKVAAGFEGLTDDNVMVGAKMSKVTDVSAPVELELAFPKVSTTALAGIPGMIVPDMVTLVACSVQVMLSVVLKDQVIPAAEPDCTISLIVKLVGLIAAENTIWKFTGAILTGSA